MTIGGVFHKIVNGVHSIFVTGEHAVESVNLYLEGRPGLKADVEALTKPIKDAVVKAFEDEYAKLKASNATDAVGLMKAAIPGLIATVKTAFVDQAKHAGNVDLILSVASAAAEALLGL